MHGKTIVRVEDSLKTNQSRGVKSGTGVSQIYREHSGDAGQVARYLPT